MGKNQTHGTQDCGPISRVALITLCLALLATAGVAFGQQASTPAANSASAIVGEPEVSEPARRLDLTIFQVTLTPQTELGVPVDTETLRRLAEEGGAAAVLERLRSVADTKVLHRHQTTLVLDDGQSLDLGRENPYVTTTVQPDGSRTTTQQSLQSGLRLRYRARQLDERTLDVQGDIDYSLPEVVEREGVDVISRETLSIEGTFRLAAPDTVAIQRCLRSNTEKPYELILVWKFSPL
jgi:hypothetical protein